MPFHNVRMRAREQVTDVFSDEDEVDMLAVMDELSHAAGCRGPEIDERGSEINAN